MENGVSWVQIERDRGVWMVQITDYLSEGQVV